jgi:peptidoglycan hydrolase-like protein with peptidoglycan-binding domain
MIRFLICLECVLLALLLLDRFAISRPEVPPAAAISPVVPATSPELPGAIPAAVAPELPGPVPATVAPEGTRGITPDPADAATRRMHHDDRMAIARDLLAITVVRPWAGDPGLPLPAAGSEVLAASIPPSATPPSATGAASASVPSAASAQAAAAPSAGPLPTASQFKDPAGREAGTRPPGGLRSGSEIGALATSRSIAEAQRLLRRLGYQPGAADGSLGPRTRQAIRAYQQRIGERVDGQVNERLLAHLRRDAREVAGRSGSRPTASAGTGANDGDGGAGLIGVILGSYQRLVGHDFDSVRRPTELKTYCRSQPDSWIYDEGRRDVLHCGQVALNHRG